MNTSFPSFADDLDLDDITVAPQKGLSTHLAKCYLAGKIDKDDWRHEIVPGLRGHSWNDGAIITDAFTYVAPFFFSCDHGCNHAPGSHGATAGFDHDESPYSPQDVIENNMAALASADLVFAYITAPDCYGTLMEIGWALAKGKRVVLAFPPGFDTREFWYVSGQCAAVHLNVRECCISDLIKAEMRHLNNTQEA